MQQEKKVQEIEAFIKDVQQKTGKKKVVIACSGGIDSSVALALLTGVVEKENISVLFLPFKNLNPEGLRFARQMTTFLKLPEHNVHLININEMVDSAKNTLHVTSQDTIRLGNIMARMRMITIYDFAKKIDALVCGTENKSEYYLGYYTRFGDEASDFEPIRHLYKTEIYELAKFLQIPKEVIEQKPTAGLWENQTDESELGFLYLEIDKVLRGFFEEHKAVEVLQKAGLDNAGKILNLVKRNEYKHNVPYVLTQKD